MNIQLDTPGEIQLLINDPKTVQIDKLEPWQVDQLLNIDPEVISTTCSLAQVDSIVEDWLDKLTPTQWAKIKQQTTLHGIPIPKDWIKVWRIILKEPSLRNSWIAARGGRKLGTYFYFWNIWAEECIEKYLSDMDKELLDMVDAGYLHSEIGNALFLKYGDEFYKPRKKNSTTTLEQVVNNYMYNKLPTKIARQELLEYCKMKIKRKASN